ncbi:HNH endonuclease signature motif containing protein [Mariniluteicoccus endophyticus]
MDTPAARTLQSLPDRPALIGGLRDTAERIRQAEIDQLLLLAACAQAYSWIDEYADHDADARVLHGERLLPIGADGTPDVAEFLTLEVGPALGISPGAASQQISDVLNLQHRHPRLWAHVIAGHVRFTSARKVAQAVAARGLSQAQALKVDERLAPFAPGMGTTRMVNQAERLCAVVDPEGEEHRRQRALDERYVQTQPAEGGVIEMSARLDGAAGLRLEATITELAGILATQPDPPPSDRPQASLIAWPSGGRNTRARALELLATPARAAAVLAAGRGETAPVAGDMVLELEVRVRPDEVDHGAGGEVTGLGVVARSQLDHLLATAAKVVVRPVVDLNVHHQTSGYVPTPAQRWAVLAREQVMAFPFATRQSRSRFVDLDHVVPWPAGPTATHNLIPLDRRAHRAKTHGGFRVEPVRPGVAKWTTPAGQTYWVSPHGTFADGPAIERKLDPNGVRRRMRAATREAARLAREAERAQLEAEASRVAARLLARAPELITLDPTLHQPGQNGTEDQAA